MYIYIVAIERSGECDIVAKGRLSRSSGVVRKEVVGSRTVIVGEGRL